MIVRNETSCLKKCLDSIKPLVDELVIVDTGSADNTMEIAKKYTDNVYEFWDANEGQTKDGLFMDFALARNHSLSMVESDWVFIIDADEFLPPESISKIREIIENTELWDQNPNKNAVYFKTKANRSKTTHNSIRLFRNNKGIIWEKPIHNHLNTNVGIYSDIRLIYSYSKAHSLDPDRALRILKKYTEEHPECLREKYYLAREYWYRKDYVTALKWYDQHVLVSKFKPERADSYLMASKCLWHLQRGDEARDYCMKALTINANFKEAVLWMAELSLPENAEAWRRYAELATNTNVLFKRVE